MGLDEQAENVQLGRGEALENFKRVTCPIYCQEELSGSSVKDGLESSKAERPSRRLLI